jgi:translation elongation factor EF-Tu-like GTPase
MSRRSLHVRFDLRSPSSGGRSGPLFSGYRSLLRFEGVDIDFGFELKLDPQFGRLGVAPGSDGTGHMSIWAAEMLPQVARGKKFEIREGTRVVGQGIVLDEDKDSV